MTIGRIIAVHQRPIVSCGSGSTVEEAARLLAANRVGAMPIYEEDRLAGIFSERDLLYSIAREGADALMRRVSEVMTRPPITVAADTEVMEALALMTRRRIRHLPVTRGETVIGFVSIGDLVKHRIELAEAEAEQMREYIRMA